MFSTVKRLGKNIAGNEAVRNNAVMKPLFSQGDLGYKSAREGMKQSKTDMKDIKKQSREVSEKVTKNKKDLSQLEKDRAGISEGEYNMQKSAYDKLAKDYDVEKAGLTSKYEGHQDKWIDNGINTLGSVGKYFKASDVDEGRMFTAAARIGAAGAVYGGAAVGTRAINGGGATYNNRGERDIAGIPFI